MKKWLVVAIAVMAVFGMSAGAFAGCHNCEKCPDGYLDCDLTEAQGEEAQCDYFDYENPGRWSSSSYAGDWCQISVDDPGVNDDYETCRVLFDICQCDDPAGDFKEGDTISIRMTLLINDQPAPSDGGFYFADDTTTDAIPVQTFENEEDACTYIPGAMANFGNIEYFDAEGNSATPYDGHDCEIESPADAVILCSVQNAGYVVTAADVNDNRHWWWIDLPWMRIDPNILHNSEQLGVLIEFINAASGGICEECEVICQCVVDIAIVCCPPSENLGCIYFPYVLQQEAGWITGIGLSNLNFSGADWSPTITFTDKDGGTFDASPTYSEGTVAFSIDQLVTDNDWEPAEGNGWLKIVLSGTNPWIDAFAYYMFTLDDLMFGAAVHAKECPCGS